MLPPAFTLPFHPLNLKRRYGLIFHIRQGGREQKLHHEVEVACTSRTPSGEFRFLVDKKQVYINNMAPSSLLDVMADRCGKVLYPLMVLVNAEGRFKGIENGDVVRRRWQDARPELAQYYTGKIAEDILAGMDAAVASDRYLADVLSRDWLFALLFAPIYHPYERNEALVDIQLPMIPYRQPLLYTLQLKAQPELTRGGLIQLEANGVCTDKRSLEDAVKGSPIPLLLPAGSPLPLQPQGLVTLSYKVYPHNGTLFSVTGTCSLQLPDGVEKIVDIELYQLGERDPIPVAGPTPSVILEAAPVVKKKSWYSFLK